MLDPQSQTYQHQDRFAGPAYEGTANLLYSSNNIASHPYQQYHQQQQQQQHDYGEHQAPQVISSNNYIQQQQQQQQLQSQTFQQQLQHDDHLGHSQNHTQQQQHQSHQHHSHQHSQPQHHQQPFATWPYHSYQNHSSYHHTHSHHHHHHLQQQQAAAAAQCEEATEPLLQVDNYQEAPANLLAGGGGLGNVPTADLDPGTRSLRAINGYGDLHSAHSNQLGGAAQSSSSLSSSSSQSSSSSLLLQPASSHDVIRAAPTSASAHNIKLAPAKMPATSATAPTTTTTTFGSSAKSLRTGRASRVGRTTRRSTKPSQPLGRRALNSNINGTNSSGQLAAELAPAAPTILLGGGGGGGGVGEDDEQELSAYSRDADFEDTSTFIVVTDPKSGRSVHLTNEQLIGYSARQLNKTVAGFPPATIKELKQRRRRLKNRGYAQNCRHKRLDHKIKLERQNDDLRAKNQEQARLIVELRQENGALKQQIDALLHMKH